MKPLSSLTIIGLLLAANPLFAETVTVEPGQSLQEAADKLQPGDTLLVLTDGKPNDLDQYEGRYGIEDTRQAVIAATMLPAAPVMA